MSCWLINLLKNLERELLLLLIGSLFLGVILVCLLSSLLFLQESKVLKFLGFMWNPLSWVMEAAAIMAIALANGGVSCCTPLIIYFV